MKDILGQLAKIKLKNVKFPEKVGEGETVVGTLPDYLKRFFGLMLQTAAQVKTEQGKIRLEYERLNADFNNYHLDAAAHDETVCSEKRRILIETANRHNSMTKELEALRDIFWKMVRVEFDLHLVSDIGIREGGQVVTIPKKAGEHDLDDILGMFSPGRRRVMAMASLLGGLGGEFGDLGDLFQ